MKLPVWYPTAVAAVKDYKIPIGILGGLLVLSIFGFCRAKPGAVPQKEQHSLDSVTITKPIYQAARDTLVRTETKIVTRVIHDTAVAHRAYDDAAKAQARADSLQAVAARADSSASLWHLVADARTQEAADLHVTVDTLVAALRGEKSARDAADSRSRIDSARAAALDNLSQRLATDVKRASECRVLLILGCPSRKASFVVGALTAVTAGAAVHYHHQLGF